MVLGQLNLLMVLKDRNELGYRPGGEWIHLEVRRSRGRRRKLSLAVPAKSWSPRCRRCRERAGGQTASPRLGRTRRARLFADMDKNLQQEQPRGRIPVIMQLQQHSRRPQVQLNMSTTRWQLRNSFANGAGAVVVVRKSWLMTEMSRVQLPLHPNFFNS